eukprot:90885_1
MSNIHTLGSIRRRDEYQQRNPNNPLNEYRRYHMSDGVPSSSIQRWSKRRKLIYSMIGINCMAYLGWKAYPEFMWKHFLLSNRNIQRARYHVLVTSSYSHEEFMHLAFNMYALYHNGLNILDRISFEKFFILYIGSGMMASVATLFWNIKINKKREVYSMGASGSLMGLNVVLALIPLYQQWQLASYLDVERNVQSKIKKFLLNLTGKDVLFLLLLQAFSGKDHAGHLGGAFGGWLFWKTML